MKITKEMTVEEIKNTIKDYITNVPNKTLIYSYVFNDEGFGQLFNLTDNPRRLVINNYNEFIENQIIEDLRDWYFESKEYLNSIKVYDEIELRNFGQIEKGLITNINHGKDRKGNKIITSINYEYEHIRDDLSVYHGKSRIDIKNNPTSSLYRKGLNIRDIQSMAEGIFRGAHTFGKYDKQRYNSMKEAFISYNNKNA